MKRKLFQFKNKLIISISQKQLSQVENCKNVNLAEKNTLFLNWMSAKLRSVQGLGNAENNYTKVRAALPLH